MDWSAMTLDEVVRFDAALIGWPADDVDIAPLLRTAGGRAIRRLAWSEAGRLVEIAPRVVVVASVASAGDGVETALDTIERHRGYTGCPVIVVIEPDQIDAAIALLDRSTHLLCRPTDAELVAALAIAGGAVDAVADIVSEGEAARLQRLNEEVARIAEALSRLTKREGPIAIANDVRTTFETRPPEVTIEASEIRRTIRARRLRDRQFGQGLFEDPAWDMLLDLFAAELERGQVSVSSLCVAAAVAPTTALRWIAKLTDAGLFRRQPDPFDRRRAFIELSPTGSAGMRGYVAAARAAGLPIA